MIHIMIPFLMSKVFDEQGLYIAKTNPRSVLYTLWEISDDASTLASTVTKKRHRIIL